MKKSLLSFGNRFSALAAKPSRSSSPMEMDLLENRVLLSGIGTGLGKKSVSFNDADGDLVKVAISGDKNATFDIDLGGAEDNADIANIQINGNGSLSIVVTPVGSLSKPSVPAVSGTSPVSALWDVTPGYTNVGSITAAAGVTTVGSIGLTAAVVDDINLPGVTVNNIALNTGKVAQVDSVMSRNTGTPYSPNLGIIDFHDITAGKINQIGLAGSLSGVNDFLGDITVSTGIGRIVGSNSMIDGQILVEGAKSTVGNIVVSGWGTGSGLTATGDLTFNAAGFSGDLEVGGHLNLGITSNGAFTGTIHAVGGISGLKASTTDSINIAGADVKGQILTDGDMAGLIFTNSDVDHGSFVANKIGSIMIGNKGGANFISNSTFEAPTIGIITSYANGVGSANTFLADDLGGFVVRNGHISKTNVIDVADVLGNIDITNGDMEAKISAGSVADVTVHGGNFTGTILADTTVGHVTVSGGQVSGVIVAGGDIASVSATWLDHTAAGDGLTASAVIHSGGNIVAISGSSVNGDGIDSSSITADGSITTLVGTSYDGGSGIKSLVPVADSIGSIAGNSSDAFGITASTFTAQVGSIGTITGTGFTGGLSGVTANAATDLGAILGTATATGDGIFGSTFNAIAGDVTSITGTTVSTAAGDAGLDTVTLAASGNLGPVTGTAFSGSGINGGSFVSSHGNIAAISGTSLDINGSGHGINGAVITAHNGSISDITGSAHGGGDGLKSLTVTARTSVGTLSGTSLTGNAINGGTVTGASIEAIDATVDGITGAGIGINALTATATAGDIGAITVDSSSTGAGIFGGTFKATGNIAGIAVNSVGIGISGGTFTADSDSSNAGDISAVTVTVSGAGNDGINGAAFKGANIGDVTVHQTALTGAGDGIDTATFTATTKTETAPLSGLFNNLGTIGDITVTVDSSDTAADGIVGSSFGAGAAGSIGNVAVTTHGGDGIVNTPFSASSTTGTDTLFTGTVGTVTVNAADIGISNGDFTAEAGIGAILVNSGESGIIAGSSFLADANADSTGALTSVTVTTNEAGFDGINGSTFTGASIGAISVTLTATTGAGDGIDTATFTATTNTETAAGSGKFNNLGTIGAITVTNASTDTAADGIVGSSFTAGAAGSIGNVAVTTSGGDGIVNTPFSASATTGTDTVFTGSVGTVTVSAADIGISNGDFTAEAGIGAIVVNSGESGIIAGSSFLADANGDNSGAIASVTVTTKEAGFDGINGSTFTGASIGNISVTQSATTGTGDGIDTATFTASTNTDDGTGKFNNLGTIGTITVSTASTGVSHGINGSTFNAGAAGDIGAITVTTQASSALLGSTFNARNTTGTDSVLDSTIGAIQILGTGTGITSGTFSSESSIGAITSAGTASQAFTLTTGSVGAMTFNSMANGSTLTATVNSATTLGAVTVSNPTAATTGNFTLVGGAALTTLGNFTVNGNVTLPTMATVTTVGNIAVNGSLTLGALANVTKFGNLAAGSLAAPAGNIAIGNATPTGTSIGQITLTNDPVGNAGNRYVFNFDSYNGTPDATIGGASYTAVAAPGVTTTNGGITLILA